MQEWLFASYLALVPFDPVMFQMINCNTPIWKGKDTLDHLVFEEIQLKPQKNLYSYRQEETPKIIKDALEGKLKLPPQNGYQFVPSITLSSIGLTLKLRF